MKDDREVSAVEPLRALSSSETSVELRRTYLRNLIHELSTPLTPLLGYLKLFRDGSLGRLSPRQSGCIDTMWHAAARLEHVLTDLSYLLELESDTYHLVPKPVRLAGLVDQAIDAHRRDASEDQIEILLDLDESDPAVPGDEPRLAAALRHLVANAIKFNSPGGKLLIRSGRTEDGRRIRLEIFDTGVGIPPSDLDHVFDAFYQADHTSTRRFGGAGLGLHLADRVIRAHLGRLELESPPSVQPQGHYFRGVRAVVELPLEEGAEG